MLLNCSGFYYSVHCTCTHVLYCTFHFWKFHSTLCSAPYESCINMRSMKLARQQSENSAAAQSLIEIKRLIPKQFSVKLWLWQTCQTSCQHAALRTVCRETEDWRQEVSISKYQPVNFGRAAWNVCVCLFVFCSFVCFCLLNFTLSNFDFSEGKALFYTKNQLTHRKSRLLWGQIKQENCYWDKECSWLGT